MFVKGRARQLWVPSILHPRRVSLELLDGGDEASQDHTEGESREQGSMSAIGGALPKLLNCPKGPHTCPPSLRLQSEPFYRHHPCFGNRTEA